MDMRQFLADASQATHRQGIDKVPVAYMGAATYRRLLASIQPSCPAALGARRKTVNGVEIFLVREDDDYYHMTFRRMTPAEVLDSRR